MKTKTFLAILLVNFSLILLIFKPSFAQDQHKIDSLKAVLAIAKQDCPDPCRGDTTQIKTLLNLGDQYEYTIPDTALFYYQKALKIAENKNEKKFIAKCNRTIGLFYYYQSNYSKTLEHWQIALKINEEIGDKDGIAINLANIGQVYKNQSNYPKALGYYQESLKIDEEIGNKEGIAANLRNIGIVYKNQSNYSKVLEYYQKSLKIYEEIGDKKEIAFNLVNIGIVYHNQSNYPKALKYYQKALKINEEIGDKEGIAANLRNIGIIYDYQYNYPKALEYYHKALKIYKEIGDKSGIATNIGDIGAVYQNQSNYPKALKYYQKALKINEEIGYRSNEAFNLNEIGSLYNDLKQYNKAIDYANRGLEIAKDIGALEDEKFAYSQLSVSYIGLKQYNKAAEYLDKRLSMDNKDILLNFTILSEKEKQMYFASLEPEYNKYNSFVLQNTDSFPTMIENVYNNTVKNKGLLLKSNTAMRNAIFSSNDTTLMKEYDNWILLKRQIAKKHSDGGDASELEEKANDIEASLVKNSNMFSDFNKVQNISWKQVQASLKENEVAIEFLHFPLMIPDSSITDFTNQVQYAALLVSKNSKQPEMIPLFEEKQLLSLMNNPSIGSYSFVKNLYGENSKLYELIWEPMEKYLKGIKTVYISPSGLLHKISFSAICKEINIYLCDNYDINIQSTTGKIYMPENSEINENISANIFGGINYNTDSTETEVWSYLDGTLTETQIINFFLEDKKIKTNYFTEKEASEEIFKKISPECNILHLATHGFFYPSNEEVKKDTTTSVFASRSGSSGFGVSQFVKNPNPLMRSGLVLAGANDVWQKQYRSDKEDGVLTAMEVSSIDLRKTQLVVLSACETGLGDIRGTEGVYGLQRAFKMAGAKFLIMSLWEVPDKETEEFMTTFYSKLLAVKDIKQAFNQTQKEMRAKYDPYYWAAFVLIE